jgi:hypothetical protein
MDELARLRSFAAVPSPTPETRARAERALRVAIARPLSRSRRPLVLAAAALALAAVLAAGAYAIERVVVGSPAPQSVKNVERILDQIKGEMIPLVHRQSGIEVEKTRAAAVLHSSKGTVYLWVAPTRFGGYCLFTQIAGDTQPDGRPRIGGGCNTPSRGFNLMFSQQRFHGGLLGLVYGRVAFRGARSVEIRYAVARPRVVKLTPGGYLLAEIPALDEVHSVLALDARGHVLGRQVNRPMPPPTLPIGTTHAVATLRTLRRHRVVYLRAAPGQHGKLCLTLDTPGGLSFGCSKRPPANDFDVSPSQIGAAPKGIFLLYGVVGANIRSLELRFEDGIHVALTLHHSRFVLYQIAPRHFASGHRPTELVARNGAGRIVKVSRFGFKR